MTECCRPFHCKFVDGLLAVFLICASLGGGILLATVYLDQEMNKGHCLILNLSATVNNIEIPERVNMAVCESIKIVAISQIVIPLVLIILSWMCGFSSFIGWWIFKAILMSLETVVALAVGVGFTTALLIFCGQLFSSTKMASCVAAAEMYDRIHSVNHSVSDRNQVTLDHAIVAVSASWFTFLSCLITACILLVQSCIRHYQAKLEKLEQTAEYTRLALLYENRRSERAQSNEAPYDPPPAYHIQCNTDDQTPLIRF